MKGFIARFILSTKDLEKQNHYLDGTDILLLDDYMKTNKFYDNLLEKSTLEKILYIRQKLNDNLTFLECCKIDELVKEYKQINNNPIPETQPHISSSQPQGFPFIFAR